MKIFSNSDWVLYGLDNGGSSSSSRRRPGYRRGAAAVGRRAAPTMTEKKMMGRNGAIMRSFKWIGEAEEQDEDHRRICGDGSSSSTSRIAIADWLDASC